MANVCKVSISLTLVSTPPPNPATEKEKGIEIWSSMDFSHSVVKQMLIEDISLNVQYKYATMYMYIKQSNSLRVMTYLSVSIISSSTMEVKTARLTLL